MTSLTVKVCFAPIMECTKCKAMT